MKNMENADHKGVQKKPQMRFDLEMPAEEHIAESEGDGVVEIIDETEIELTLGPSSYNNRRKKVETPLTSDSGNSLSSSTGSSHINKTSSREGLSGGGIIGHVQIPDSNRVLCQSGIRNTSHNIEEQSRQDRLKKQPPWLFQVLSLNMT